MVKSFPALRAGSLLTDRPEKKQCLRVLAVKTGS